MLKKCSEYAEGIPKQDLTKKTDLQHNPKDKYSKLDFLDLWKDFYPSGLDYTFFYYDFKPNAVDGGFKSFQIIFK